MSLYSFLATAWFILYPLILAGSIVLSIIGIAKRKWKEPLYFFSLVFCIGIFLGYLYYLFGLFYIGSPTSASLIDATISFYFEFYFLNLWLFFLAIALTVVFKLFRYLYVGITTYHK
jgi:hypothetical protein